MPTGRRPWAERHTLSSSRPTARYGPWAHRRTASRFWGYSAIGLKTDGSLWGWGSNSSSQLGLDGAGARVTPERIGTDNDWKMVTMGVSHTMAIKADGSLWGWGQNYNGQLGTGDTESRPKPVRIGADNDWAYVKAIDNRTYGPRATTT